MTGGCYGILLAGGRAQRMGGGDKALRRIGGVPILERVIAAMAPQCAGLLISANGDPARFESYGLPVVADDVAGFKGPLAGILAGLDWIAAHSLETTVAVSAPTDTPFLPFDLVRRLEAARDEAGAAIACARSGGATHPVIALWPVSIRPDLRHALVDEDERKVDRFIQRYGSVYADWKAQPFDPFFNVNSPTDLAAAQAIAARQGEAIVIDE